MSHRSARRPARILAILAIVASAVAAGCAMQPARSSAELAADEELAARVDQALRSDQQIYARHVEVDVRRGMVRLSGFVFSSDDLYGVKRVAANVPGVTGVVNQLELMVGGRTGAR